MIGLELAFVGAIALVIGIFSCAATITSRHWKTAASTLACGIVLMTCVSLVKSPEAGGIMVGVMLTAGFLLHLGAGNGEGRGLHD